MKLFCPCQQEKYLRPRFAKNYKIDQVSGRNYNSMQVQKLLALESEPLAVGEALKPSNIISLQ
jgi:hypothetical protein